LTLYKSPTDKVMAITVVIMVVVMAVAAAVLEAGRL
jgi:hypothetical protein